MAKEVEALIKLQIKAGAANPSPPVGPALGSKGVNIMDFCKQFNARTQDQAGKSPLLLFSFWKQQNSNPVLQNLTVKRWLLCLGTK